MQAPSKPLRDQNCVATSRASTKPEFQHQIACTFLRQPPRNPVSDTCVSDPSAGQDLLSLTRSHGVPSAPGGEGESVLKVGDSLQHKSRSRFWTSPALTQMS